jgi:hypothetical protein
MRSWICYIQIHNKQTDTLHLRNEEYHFSLTPLLLAAWVFTVYTDNPTLSVSKQSPVPHSNFPYCHSKWTDRGK